MPRATRTTTIKQPGTVIINPPAASPGETTVETTQHAPKNFWEEQEILNTAEGKDYSIYLYRLQPVTPGLKGYIAKFASPVTQEEIKESFGGYDYRISLHKGSKWICGETFSISAPPKATGVADPAMLAGSMHPGQGMGDPSTITQQVLSFVNQRLEKERIDKKDDPAYLASLNLVQKAAEQAISAAMSRNSNPVAEQMQGNMMQMMMSMMTTMTNSLLQRALETPQKSTVSSLKELIEIVPLLTGGKGIGGLTGGKVDPIAQIGQSLISAAPQILSAGADFMGKYQQIAQERTRQAELQYNAIALSRGAAPVHPQTTFPPATPVAPVQNQTAIPAQPAQPARAVPANSLTVEPFTEVPPVMAPANGQPSDEWLRNKIVELISRGASGDMIMAFISGSNETFAQAMKACTEAQIRGFFATDPILVQALNMPNFDQTLAEALQYLHPEGMSPVVPN